MNECILFYFIVSHLLDKFVCNLIASYLYLNTCILILFNCKLFIFKYMYLYLI